MKILGINEGHGASACIIINGKVVVAASEERFSRRKNDDGYPEKAIQFCLDYSNISPQELDAVADASIDLAPAHILIKRIPTFKIKDYVLENKEYWKPFLIEGKQINYYYDFVKKHPELRHDKEPPYDLSFLETSEPKEWINLFRKERLRNIVKKLGLPESKVHFVDHHSAHAAYAYYASPLRDNMLVLTADAWGDGANGSIGHGHNNNLTIVKKTANNNLARLYGWATLILGMRPHEHEYKVMGLAPYSKDYIMKEPFEVYSSTLVVDGDDFKWNVKPPDMYFWFKEKLEGCRFDGIAAGVQKFIEVRMIKWIRNIISESKHSKITFSGGLALNIKLNKKITEIDGVQMLVVPPSGGDESLSVGAAYHFAVQYCDKHNIDKSMIRPLNDVCLGPDFTNEEIKQAIKRRGGEQKYKVRERVSNKEIARYLAEGHIIARFSGRMEFGPRALGNRSILASPEDPETIRIINEMIKFRDFWMPFTPSILKERTNDYLVNPKGIDSSFMTIGFDSTDLGKKYLKAAIHPYDKTVRPQFVDKELSPDYQDLISEFEKLTGIGAVLNTSLNLHGEPIVCTPDDALHVLDKSGLKMLLMNNILIKKRKS